MIYVVWTFTENRSQFIYRVWLYYICTFTFTMLTLIINCDKGPQYRERIVTCCANRKILLFNVQQLRCMDQMLRRSVNNCVFLLIVNEEQMKKSLTIYFNEYKHTADGQNMKYLSILLKIHCTIIAEDNNKRK